MRFKAGGIDQWIAAGGWLSAASTRRAVVAFVLPEQLAIGDLIVEGDFAAPVGFWGKDPGAGITGFEAALTSRDFEVDDGELITVDVSEAGE